MATTMVPRWTRGRTKHRCWPGWQRRPRRGPWRSGLIGALAFVVWATRLRLIALIEEAAVIGRVLRHLGVPTEIPTPRPARAPPLPVEFALWMGEDDDPSVFPPCS
jgi:hypothetical protein